MADETKTNDKHKRLPGLLSEPPITLYPSLAVRVGVNKALLLQQIHFLTLGKEKDEDERFYFDGKWWVYNTYENWRRKYFPWIAVSTINRLLIELETDGILLARPYGDDSRIKYYTINYEVWETWFSSKKAYQNDMQKPIKTRRKSISKRDAKAYQNDMDLPIYKESETPSEKTTETPSREQTPPPSTDPITADAGEGQSGGGKAGGGGSDETAGESNSDPQDQSQSHAALPADCKSFLATLHGALGQRVRIMDAVTKLAWWYEVKDAQNPGGLLAHRLKDTTDRPLPGNIRKAREMLNRGISVEDVVKSTTPRVTRSRAEMDAWEAAGWDPRVLMGLPDTSKAGV